MWAAQFLDLMNPTTGYAHQAWVQWDRLPAAMGAQVAFPKRQVINIEGDGSFLMNIQELKL
ncbi:MAG: hypothetical protein Ct9H300mP23_12210 [Nitrospinota bacterium]|nr:MAG: hypothetical protein Ct9H300mP23_12210 [Nitrospinota bacterium]